MFKEFRSFIMTGNVLELAVAVILAGAIGLVVKGFVGDIMMPIVGHYSGGMDFADMKVILTDAVAEVTDADGNITTVGVKESAIRYGAWINSIINLIIVGFVLFIMMKSYNKTKKKKEEAPVEPAGPTNEEVLLTEIRDALLNKQ